MTNSISIIDKDMNLDKFLATKEGYVLEVGSGALPLHASDVLLDYSDAPNERAGKLVQDRTFIYADAQALPFTNQSFDISIARHVLEHVKYPELMIQELQRVSKRGYIETPNAVAEFIEGWEFHKWIVHQRGNNLEIRPNNIPLGLKHLLNFTHLTRTAEFVHWRHIQSQHFVTRYFWQDRINYKILPALDWDNLLPSSACDSKSPNSRASVYSRLRLLIPARLLRPFRVFRDSWFAFRGKRLRNLVKIDKLLCCPICSGQLKITNREASCANCRRQYSQVNGFYDFRLNDFEIEKKAQFLAMRR